MIRIGSYCSAGGVDLRSSPPKRSFLLTQGEFSTSSTRLTMSDSKSPLSPWLMYITPTKPAATVRPWRAILWISRIFQIQSKSWTPRFLLLRLHFRRLLKLLENISFHLYNTGHYYHALHFHSTMVQKHANDFRFEISQLIIAWWTD